MHVKLSDIQMHSRTSGINIVECTANCVHLHIYTVNMYTELTPVFKVNCWLPLHRSGNGERIATFYKGKMHWSREMLQFLPTGALEMFSPDCTAQASTVHGVI